MLYFDYRFYKPVDAFSMFVLVLNPLIVLDNMKSSLTLFKLLWAVGAKKNNLARQTTTYHCPPKRHITIYIHVAQFQNSV